MPDPPARPWRNPPWNVHVLGFADIDYFETDRSVDDGFFLGQLVGHAAAGLSERTTFFAEVSATARPDEYRIEVERLIQMYFRPARRASRSRSPAPGVRRALPDLLPPRPSRVPRDTGRCPRPRAGRRLARVAPSIPGMIID